MRDSGGQFRQALDLACTYKKEIKYFNVSEGFYMIKGLYIKISNIYTYN